MKKDNAIVFFNIIKSALTLLLVLGTLIGVVWVGLGFYNDVFGRVEDIIVPSVINSDIVEAKHKIEESGLKVDIQKTYSDTVKKDMVISQKPEGGRKVKTGRKVFITVSLGGELVSVPNLKGMTVKESEIKLQEAGLKYIVEKEVPHDNIPKGRVVDQDPPALSISTKNSTVKLSLSSGPEVPKEVPEVVGVAFPEAKSKLEKAGFVIGKVVWIEDQRFGSGVVLSQLPLPKEKLKSGSLISLEVVAGVNSGSNVMFQQDLITIVVPKAEKDVFVEVFLTDRYGKGKIYEATHKNGDKFNLTVSSTGGGKIEIYFDKTLGFKADL